MMMIPRLAPSVLYDPTADLFVSNTQTGSSRSAWFDTPYASIMSSIAQETSDQSLQLSGPGSAVEDQRRTALDSTSRTLLSKLTAKPIYILPNDPFTTEVLIPAFNIANRVDIMVGFFTTRALTSVAAGLATFINETSGVLRLVISPVLSDSDLNAIQDGLSTPTDLIDKVLDDLLVTEDLITHHTLTCLVWLLKAGRLEIKVAILDGAIFHPKVWLFHHDNATLAAHGSSNLTHAGIHDNVEQIAVSKSWDDANQNYITRRLSTEFGSFWKAAVPNCYVLPLPAAIQEQLLTTYETTHPPQEADLQVLYERASARIGYPGSLSRTPPLHHANSSFHIPSTLNYHTGPFAHQGVAVKAWLEAEYKGILEMATGSGKTITSLIAAHYLYQKHRPLLIVVAAPYIPLIQQWCDEIHLFGLDPINVSELKGPRARARVLGRLRRLLRSHQSDLEVLVVSHRLLSDLSFHEELQRFRSYSLLIADEAHNLGSSGFISNPPSFFDFYLGLSATPVRQGDTEGTEQLLDVLGPIVFSYPLAEAVGSCLVEYDYFVHPILLSEREMDSWYELSAKIRANSWRRDTRDRPDDYLKRLYRERRIILELAEEKLTHLSRLLSSETTDLQYTLIYTSDKNPDQLNRVNRLLIDRGILFHQLTYEETADRSKTKRILGAFQEGALNVLTAKRVLDEGVNIPQIKTAYILASTTVERQWIQRRGRILRKCPAIKKTYSTLHDFVVLPSSLRDIDQEERNLLRSELERVQEFASLARNAGAADGPLALIDRLVHVVFDREVS